MKKSNLFLLVFILTATIFLNAQVCPPSMPLLGQLASSGATIANGSVFNCNTASPFYITANENDPSLPQLTTTNADTTIFTPCISTDYNLFYAVDSSKATESFYEGGASIGCIGPVGAGCSFALGYGNGVNANPWDVLLSYLDPTQSHAFVFSHSAGTWTTTTVSMVNCWTNANYTTTPANPVTWASGTPTFTLNMAANTNIGTATYSLSPSVPGALTDFLMGQCYINTALLSPGTYTVTYHFTGPHCLGGATSNFVFTIANPYVANWTPPGALCSNVACISLPPTENVGTTAGGTWSGTDVSGTNFCPATSGAGNFAVTYSVGFSASCKATQTHTITVNAAPSFTLSAATYSMCTGGSVGLSVSGPVGATYTWTPATGLNNANSPTPTASPATTTVYTVTGTSSANCVTSSPLVTTVTVNSPPTISLVSPATQTMCPGGSVGLSVSGASTYTWSPSGSLNNANSATPTASPGSNTVYTVSGTSAAGCPSTNTLTTNVTIPTPVTLTLTSNGNYTMCPGGSVGMSVTGASTYTWSPAGSLNNNNSATPTASPGVTTIYTVTATSANGCPAAAGTTATVTIATPVTLTISPSNSFSICPGSSVTMTVTGASSYTWSPAGSLNNANSATPSANPVSTTVYTVNGTSANGCAANTGTTATVTINTPPTLSVTPPTGYTVCPGGTVGMSVSGAGAGGTYTWTPAGSLNNANSPTPNATPGSTTVYTVNGTDAIGCVSTTGTTATVTVNTPVTLTVVASPASLCTGQTTTITASGGSTYTWSANAGNATTNSVTVTPAGTDTYTVNGTDASGCSTLTGTVSVAIGAGLTVTITPSQAVLCTGQTETLTASGATNYTWMPGGFTTPTLTVNPTSNATYSLTGNSGGCSGNTVLTVTVATNPTITATSAASSPICPGASTTLTASGAGAGGTYTWTPAGSLNNANSSNPTSTPNATTVYTLTGTSAAGCAATTPATTTVTVDVPQTLTLTPSPASLCTGGTTTITATGASTYTWSANAGGVASPTVAITPAGTDTYTVNATDINGCSNPTQTVSVAVGAALTVSITASQSNLCTGQTATLTASGASTYTWSPGNVIATTLTVSPNSNTTYSLVGSNGSCSGDTTLIVTVTTTPVVTAASAGTGTICSGTSTTLTANGATNYTWMPGGANTSTISVTPNTTTDYTLTGESGGCSNTSVTSVSVTTTPTVGLSVSTGTANLCSGQSTVLSATGSATSFTWMPGGASTASNTVTPGVGTTTYTLTGANGACAAASQTVNVTVIPSPTLSVSSSASVSGICSGSTATLTASGATNYTWMPGSINSATATVSPNTTTDYTLTGESGGCTVTSITTVTVSPTPTLAITVAPSNTICAGQSITLSAATAAGYTWMPGGANTAGITDNALTTTVYTVTGANGPCTSTAVTTVIVNPTPSVTALPQIDSARCGMPSGVIHQVIASGGTPGTPPYTYQWYNGSTLIPGATLDSLAGVGIGTFSVTVTDANGCTVSAAQAIFPVLGSGAVVASISPSLTQGQSPVSVTFSNTTTGATVYNWNFGNGFSSLQNPSQIFTAPGTYTVVMTASAVGNCSDSDTAYVIVDEATTIIIPNIFSPNGDGLNDNFFINTTGMKSLHCDIFNRWGTKMYTLLAPSQVWDGKTPNGESASDGTYFYILTCQGYDGKTYDRQGPLTLVK